MWLVPWPVAYMDSYRRCDRHLARSLGVLARTDVDAQPIDAEVDKNPVDADADAKKALKWRHKNRLRRELRAGLRTKTSQSVVRKLGTLAASKKRLEQKSAPTGLHSADHRQRVVVTVWNGGVASSEDTKTTA